MARRKRSRVTRKEQMRPPTSIRREMRAYYRGRSRGRKPGYIYLIHLYGDIYKIGKSVNPGSRLKSIRTSSPDAEIVFQVHCEYMGMAEKLAHDILSDKHHKYETYQFPDTMIDRVKEDMEYVASLTPKRIHDERIPWR